jgi:pyridoxal phosphate enzyme (YggS family)
VSSSIADNLAAVRARIARAAERCGRAPDSVRLIAVSKTFGLDVIRAAIAAGQRDFGENKVQEALPKIEALGAEPPPNGDLTWHLIGHLQSNKARKAARPFDVIHSVDSLDLARRIDVAAVETHRRPQLLVQVDLAGEATKHGIQPDEVRGVLDAASDFRAASFAGLMVIPPWIEDPEAVRPYFRRLRELRDALVAGGVDPARLRELSMGMSHDFEAAIEEGATMVRVGTAIFGKRPPVSL